MPHVSPRYAQFHTHYLVRKHHGQKHVDKHQPGQSTRDDQTISDESANEFKNIFHTKESCAHIPLRRQEKYR